MNIVKLLLVALLLTSTAHAGYVTHGDNGLVIYTDVTIPPGYTDVQGCLTLDMQTPYGACTRQLGGAGAAVLYFPNGSIPENGTVRVALVGNNPQGVFEKYEISPSTLSVGLGVAINKAQDHILYGEMPSIHAECSINGCVFVVDFGYHGLTFVNTNTDLQNHPELVRTVRFTYPDNSTTDAISWFGAPATVTIESPIQWDASGPYAVIGTIPYGVCGTFDINIADGSISTNNTLTGGFGVAWKLGTITSISKMGGTQVCLMWPS